MHKLKTNKTFSKPQLLIFALAFALIGYLIFRSFALNPNLPGDLNNDNTVNIQDLSILLSNYGTTNATADINGDGTVNILDMSILLSNYGKSIVSGQLGALEAENMSSPGTNNGNVYTDSAASGGQARAIWGNGTTSGSVNLTGSANKLTVVASGSNCVSAGKYPVLSVSIDNVNYGSQNVTSTVWANYDFTISAAAGTHTLALTFSGDYAQTGVCDVNLNLDVARFSSSATGGGGGTTFDPTRQTFLASAWVNKPVVSNPILDTNSATWMSMLMNAGGANGLFFNGTNDMKGAWAESLWRANNSTPTYAIHFDVGVNCSGCGGTSGIAATKVPIAPGWTVVPPVGTNPQDPANPGTAADQHYGVVNVDTGQAWDFQFMYANSDGTPHIYTDASGNKYVRAHSYESYNLYTSDALYDSTAISPEPGNQVTGTPALAGFNTPYDFTNSGPINHALKVSTNTNGPGFRFPANQSDGTHAGGIPFGAHFWLPRSTDLTPYNLRPEQLKVAHQLMDYGAYDLDSSGAFAASVESIIDGSTYSFGSPNLPASLISKLVILASGY